MPPHAEFRPLSPRSQPQDMAQVQRPPSFPTPNFLGRSDSHAVPGPQLPPLHGRPTSRGSGYPSVHIPPLEPRPMPSDVLKSASRSIPVSQLLSSDSPSPKKEELLSSLPLARSPPLSAYGSSPNEPLQRQPVVHPAAPGHRLEHPPKFGSQQAQHTSSHTFGFPQSQYSRSGLTETQPQSPGATTPYSSAPSYHDSFSEPSPRSAVPSAPSLPRISEGPPLTYDLALRQQPVAARACGFGERDRRVIDPPPILELKIRDRVTGAPAQDPNGMLALHCTLLHAEINADATQVQPTNAEMQSTRRLMGTLVASPYQAKDEHGIAGTFFVFPDLSCRSPGRFRLHFKLLRIDPMNMQLGAVHGTVASIVTDVFSVYTAKDFPGMRASSALLKSLRRQGLNVGVKKGSEARKGKGKQRKDGASDDSDDDSDEYDIPRRGSAHTGDSGSGSDASPRTKAAKKLKRRRRDS